MVPLHERVSAATAIVIGKVTGIEKDTVEARPFNGAGQKSAYQIASVKIVKALRGAKGLTDIRVGFLKQGAVAPQPIRGGRVLKRGQLQTTRPVVRPYPYQPSLTEGQEGLLFLNKHFQADFYVMVGYQGFINKEKNAAFDKDVELVKRCLKLLDKPVAGLKSKDAADRLLAATMLIGRYRTPAGIKVAYRSEPIDAEESKLILAALAEADWTRNDPQMGMQTWVLFMRLGLTAKDDWMPPKVFKNYVQEISDAGKAWLKKHGDSYRIQRLVPDTRESK
jgi:hypothetical protein